MCVKNNHRKCQNFPKKSNRFRLSPHAKKSGQISAVSFGSAVRKQNLRVTAGAKIRNLNMPGQKTCTQHILAAGFPQVQLILSIRFFRVKKRIQRWFILLLKFAYHVFTHFVTTLTD